MAIRKFGVVKGSTIRQTLLDECGVPVIGATSTVVSKGFVKVDPKFEYEDGSEFLVKNSWGDFCINEKDKPRLKRVTADVEYCAVDLSIFSQTTGWRELTDGGDTIGLAANFDMPDGGVALELWAKIAGGSCSGGEAEWAYFLWPQMVNGKLNDFSIANAAATFTISVESGPIPTAWGSGPYATTALPAGIEVADGEPFAFGITTTPPPAETTGAVALAVLP